jgi:hypothetical protein
MIYTRANPDPNPTEPVYDPKKILRKAREQELVEGKSPCGQVDILKEIDS